MLVAKDTLEAMGILVAWVILVARAQQLVTQVVMDILAAWVMLVVGVIPDHKVTQEVKDMLVAKDTLEAMGIQVAWVILVVKAQ